MPSTRNQISFEELGLGAVLNRSQLRVPLNQREYSWGEREVTTLLEDFARAINEGGSAYFLGTIVTIPRDNGQLEVVDGQQRLATTAILLAAIRDYLATSDPIIAESIEHEFLTTIHREQRERVPRLTLNLDDNEVFKCLITGKTENIPTPKLSHRRLMHAHNLAKTQIKKIVSSLNAKDHGDVLNKWIEFIQYNALVVLLRVSNDANAYQMFETLNDRGLKTSQSDLVKNYLFGRAGDRLGEAQQKWALMRGALESLDNEDITIDFLRHAIITAHSFVRESQVYEAVQEMARSSHQVISLLTTLEHLANLYVAIHNPEHEKWNSYPDNVRRSIEVLNMFNIRPMRPLMLAIASKFSSNGAADAFKYLIVLCVRLLIAGTTRSTSVELPLATTANKIQTEEITSVAEVKRSLKDVMPSNEQFRQAFEIATVSNARLARYYLRSLEMAAKSESEPWLIPNDDRQVINLEHVLPHKTEGRWPQFTEEEAAAHVKRIGNLTLLQASRNSDLRSNDFEAKKRIYAASPYLLTQQVASLEDWDVRAINDRQKVLADIAVRAWAP
ncbi:MAG: DUF262 domain-containing protein [Caldilineaceae bacterium]|nr:DUF262 domain-containing protein [Caldilineaceae bacterium]